MKNFESLHGVFAAALTPLNDSFQVILDDFPPFLDFLASRGCHGALLFGTTGEGPSLSIEQRLAMMKIAVEWRKENPDFQLFAGVGTPSLDETISLSRSAFEIGMDAVLALPPYFFRNVTDDGLFSWYSELITKAIPKGCAFFGYHFPRITGVPLSLDLLARLKDAYPDQFVGIKDSSADVENTRALGKRFGKDLRVFNGTDPLFTTALENGAAGCITALANLISPLLRKVWDAFQNGGQDVETQNQLISIRAITDRYAPAPPLLKFLIAKAHKRLRWSVCPPLLSLAVEKEEAVWEELNQLPFSWQ